LKWKRIRNKLLQIIKITSIDNFPSWAFVCLSVGDCKAFRWSFKTRKVCDITEGNRTKICDATDPGGRIGPYLDERTPDLRNIDLFFEVFEEGDLILLLTDGVHDNLDPQYIGKSPKDMKINASTWKEAEELYPDEAELAKTNYRNRLLEDIIDSFERKNKETAPYDICTYLAHHCETLTRNGREFLYNNVNKRIPDNIQEYPGKMDHCTSICVRVGKLQ